MNCVYVCSVFLFINDIYIRVVPFGILTALSQA